MNLLQSLRNRSERDTSPLSLDEWASYFNFFTGGWPLGGQQTLGGTQERISPTFSGLSEGAYRGNGPIFSCILLRMMALSEARFAYRRIVHGRPGELFTNPALNILDHPWPNGTTGDLLTRAVLDADLAGNAFFTTRDRAPALGTPRSGRIVRMRPDWTTIFLGSYRDPNVKGYDLDADVIGYGYQPGGLGSGEDPITLPRDAVAHFAPVPDPVFRYRGMSWLTPIITEIMADQAASAHKLKFFEHGATVNLAVTFDPVMTLTKAQEWINLFKRDHEGVMNAYKTVFVGGGADLTPIGTNLRQIEFKATQGAGETRIASAANVPPILVGFSEGLASATYSNYGMARRRFADLTCRPWWRNFAGSMATLVPVPPDAELWYDDGDIAFLNEDALDDANIHQIEAATIKLLVDAGYEADSVVDAVVSGDMTRLRHSGLFSVQLQPAGSSALRDAAGQDRSLAELVGPLLPKVPGTNGHPAHERR